MEQNASRTLVRNVMLEFADLTGLVSPRDAPQRYLWTDAFAVCNFRELYRQTSDERGLIRQTPCDFGMKQRLPSRTERLMQYIPLRENIETYWLDPSNRQTDEWMAHRDINMVMPAISLAPEGYLSL